MTDRGAGTENGDGSAILISFSQAKSDRLSLPVSFDRRELDRILRVYGRKVAANEWRDYAIDALGDRAVFSVYLRARDTPLYQIVKCPKLARRQGAYFVQASNGVILKRGHDLDRVLQVFDKHLGLVRG